MLWLKYFHLSNKSINIFARFIPVKEMTKHSSVLRARVDTKARVFLYSCLHMSHLVWPLDRHGGHSMPSWWQRFGDNCRLCMSKNFRSTKIGIEIRQRGLGQTGRGWQSRRHINDRSLLKMRRLNPDVRRSGPTNAMTNENVLAQIRSSAQMETLTTGTLYLFKGSGDVRLE